MSSRPGGAISRRRLHFFLLLDCSGSMAADGKIQALNTAVREMLPHLRTVARDNPHADLVFRAMAFSSGARWIIQQPTAVDAVVWTDVSAGGYTDLGAALQLLAREVRVPPMEQHCFPPAMVLVSDGRPTDDFSRGLQQVLAEPFGAQALRVAVAIGRDAEREVLQAFQGVEGSEPLMAHNAEQLVRMIRLASTVATRAASEVVSPEAVHWPAWPPPRPPGAAGDSKELVW